jgi:membrane associated rhomboid family serine protease
MIIVPVANSAYIRRRPYVTLGLIALNAAVWLYGFMAPAPRAPIVEYVRTVEELHTRYGLPFEDRLIFELRLSRGQVLPRSHPDFRRWRDRAREAEAAQSEGMNGYLAQRLGYIPDRGFDHRLLTALFLHGDFMHLFMNMLFLFLVGCNVEDGWGRWKFLLFYLVSGVAANLAHYASEPAGDLPLVGASGAVSAVMGAFVVFHTTTKIKFFWWFILFGFFELPAVVAIAAWFVLQVLNGVFFHLDSVVAYWAHIGGFLFGLAVAIPLRLVRGPAVRPQRIVPTGEESVVALPGARLIAGEWAYAEGLKQAAAHLAAGETEKARALYAEVLARDPKHEEARLGLIRVYQALGRRREALALGETLMADLAAAGRVDEARRVYSLLMG